MLALLSLTFPLNQHLQKKPSWWKVAFSPYGGERGKAAIIIQFLSGWKNQVQLKLGVEVKTTTITMKHSLSEHRLAIAYLNSYTSFERVSYCKSSIIKDKFILELITIGYKKFWSRLVSLQNVKMSIFESSYRSKFLQNKHIQETYIYNSHYHTNPSIFRCFWTRSYFCSKKPIISSKCHQKKQSPQSCKEASKKYPHTKFHYQS